MRRPVVVGLVRQDPAVLVDGSDGILWTKMLFYPDSRTNSSNSLLHVRIIAVRCAYPFDKYPYRINTAEGGASNHFEGEVIFHLGDCPDWFVSSPGE